MSNAKQCDRCENLYVPTLYNPAIRVNIDNHPYHYLLFRCGWFIKLDNISNHSALEANDSFANIKIHLVYSLLIINHSIKKPSSLTVLTKAFIMLIIKLPTKTTKSKAPIAANMATVMEAKPARNCNTIIHPF